MERKMDGTTLMISFVVFGCLVYFLRQYLPIRRATRKLGLRDSAMVCDGNLVCTLCEYPLRIGIDHEGAAHRFCAVCEELRDDFEDEDDGGPDGDGGEPIPEEPQNTEAKSVVVSLRRRAK